MPATLGSQFGNKSYDWNHITVRPIVLEAPRRAWNLIDILQAAQKNVGHRALLLQRCVPFVDRLFAS